MVTLPIIAAVTPVASVVIGIGLLGETPKTGVPGAVAAGFAVLVASLALARLARSAPHPEPENDTPGNQEQAINRTRGHLPALTGAAPQGR